MFDAQRACERSGRTTDAEGQRDGVSALPVAGGQRGEAVGSAQGRWAVIARTPIAQQRRWTASGPQRPTCTAPSGWIGGRRLTVNERSE